ncbi:protein kinase [Streptomyces sp. 549]|uniref:serine/threonine-protein kinase n=1 Tax=Streptomyces sp. 549 TaxID=3049076 RepID=UPI0024C260E3|nr:serine/threonine-protein kinase [Streptomyces sp. 549]MDK1475610.1 protein kinase [Streptomyces sp. 549]
MAGGTQGQIIDGRFELLEPLGSGGMGTVWRARDLALQREVALKAVRPPDPVLAPEGSEASRMLRERVLREARALARLNHPHVVTIHHIIDQGEHPWLVMELVLGGSLQDLVADGPMPSRKAAAVGRDVLAALRAAHRAGIHHRDVKPGNVLLREDGSAVLTDFGIAALQDSTALTATGELIGSPEYIAPERIRGVADHPASDLWSLGMTLYVAVEGHSPLRRGTSLATLAAVLDEPVPAPRLAGPLTPVLEALLVRDPQARPDAEALDGMLAEAASGPAGDGPRSVATPTTVEPFPVQPPPVESAPTQSAPVPPGQPAFGAPPTPPPGGGAQAGPPAAAAPTLPPAPAGGGRSRRTTMAAAAAAVVVVALVVSGVLAWGSGRNGEAAGKETPSASAPGGGATANGTADGGTNGDKPATPAPDAEEPHTDDRQDGGAKGQPETSDEVSDASPDASPGADEPKPSPDAEKPGGGTEGAWVAQLFSEPVSSGTEVRDRRLAAVRTEVPEAKLLRSDDHASLNPGYWVVYATGPFTDGKDAVRYCAARGRTQPDDCVGRYLSDDADDKVYVCYPQGGGTGRCSRS